MATGTQKSAAVAISQAAAWDLVAPRELAFKFPRLTAPIRQVPELAEEPQRRRPGVLERFLRWLDEQF
ncbi:MAG TPA: hypothetical protein VGK67_34535 [Myxococcales bacterium]|jgi:hypothetical protein